MITISPRSVGRTCGTISFASTLYLCPILDLLLAEVPVRWRPELRLGLQEALVNAAKHGNKLDPSKMIQVRFSIENDCYWWRIYDQGKGYEPPGDCDGSCEDHLPLHEQECGRGLFILHQIFDRVFWNPDERELRLGKQFNSRFRLPLIT